MSRRRIITLATLAALILLAALPPRQTDIFGYLPDGAVAVGYHKNIRATWKRQLKHPIVAAILAGYGVDAKEAAREDGAVWTFRLAVGEDVASALLVDADGEPCVAAASPTGRRDLLLHFFWLVRWVPGLGRIRTSPEGFHYIDLSDDDDPDAPPLLLSVALRRGVLLAKLATRPKSLDDMLEGAPRQNGFADILRADLPEGFRHRIVFRAGDVPLPGFGLGLNFDRDITLDVVQHGNEAITLATTFPMGDDDAALHALLSHRLSGRNATVGALAASHAFALALLPSPFAADFASRALGCASGRPSTDDAVLYLTAAPYGAQFYLFAIPAITASIPGLSIDEGAFKAAMRPFLPKQLRATLAVLGEDTLCSSAASLNRQRHADPPPAFTWQNAYGRVGGLNPSAFLFLDCDPLFRELRQVAQSLVMAASFARDSIDPTFAMTARRVVEFLPYSETGAYLSAALAGAGEGRCRLALVVECPKIER